MSSIYNTLNGKRNKYADYLHSILKKFGIDFATGIPCGVQKHIIYNLSHDPDIIHIPATKESEAIGIATGSYLAGKKPIIYMQNSGFFNSSNDIASLLVPYKIPILISVTWRGCSGENAPQHFITGHATIRLIKALGLSFGILDKENIQKLIPKLFELMDLKYLPAVMLIKRGWCY